MSQDEIETLFRAGQSAIEAGEPFPTQFLIPDGKRRWRIICHDLAAVGENDLGIPPKVFAHGAVGMLLASLGAGECYAAEAAFLSTPVRPAGDSPPGDGQASGKAVVVTVFAKGRLEVHTAPYRNGDDGQVFWAERTSRSTAEPGPLGAALPLWRAVNREASPMPAPDQLVDDMVDSGFVIIVEDLPG